MNAVSSVPDTWKEWNGHLLLVLPLGLILGLEGPDGLVAKALVCQITEEASCLGHRKSLPAFERKGT